MKNNETGELLPCGCVCCEYCFGVEIADDCSPEKHNAIELLECNHEQEEQ